MVLKESRRGNSNTDVRLHPHEHPAKNARHARPNGKSSAVYGPQGKQIPQHNLHAKFYTGKVEVPQAIPLGPPRADLTKLKVIALRKYVKCYDLPGVTPYSSKDELTKAVTNHFQSQVIAEDTVLYNLSLYSKRSKAAS